MPQINWAPKAGAYLSPLQRDAIERDAPIRRLDGAITTDDAGRVWYECDGHRKLVGELASSPGASLEPERELDAPPSASKKTVKRKPKAKK